jgi:hypothetical protein
MPLQHPPSGPGSASDFIVSAVPWVTASTINGIVQHRFQDVTLSGSAGEKIFMSRWISVANVATGSATVRVAFTQRGFSTNNYFTLKEDQTFFGELRITELWISGSGNIPYELIVGLTGIEKRYALLITGCAGVPGVG